MVGISQGMRGRVLSTENNFCGDSEECGPFLEWKEAGMAAAWTGCGLGGGGKVRQQPGHTRPAEEIRFYSSCSEKPWESFNQGKDNLIPSFKTAL